MIRLAPRWALNAQAIDAAGDPHLADGVHLRVIPSQLLGLPIAPFVVYRVNLGPFAKIAKPRSDITWIDSQGVSLTPPFEVVPGNAVTGWLPAGSICCWIQVHVEASDGDGPRFPIPRPPLQPIPRGRRTFPTRVGSGVGPRPGSPEDREL